MMGRLCAGHMCNTGSVLSPPRSLAGAQRRQIHSLQGSQRSAASLHHHHPTQTGLQSTFSGGLSLLPCRKPLQKRPREQRFYRVSVSASGAASVAGADGLASSSSSDSAGGLGIRGLLHSKFDKDIFGLAVPALFSILLDPIMSLVDTGDTPVHPGTYSRLNFCMASRTSSREILGLY